MSGGGDDLFSRWSRRKRAVAEEDAADPAPQPEPHPADEAPEGADVALSQTELLEKLGLPDPDTLKAGDDFAAFMQSHVPEALRRRALRRLWSSNPVLANLDGLVDHGEDFTDAATVPETLVTAYQVGRGMLRKALTGDTPGPEAPQDAAAPSAARDASVDTEPGEGSTACAQAEMDEPPDPPASRAAGLAESEPPAEPQPRRMTFRSG